MNNENNALLHNDVEINVSEENIILAPPVELFDEASRAESHFWILPLTNAPVCDIMQSRGTASLAGRSFRIRQIRGNAAPL